MKNLARRRLKLQNLLHSKENMLWEKQAKSKTYRFGHPRIWEWGEKDKSIKPLQDSIHGLRSELDALLKME